METTDREPVTATTENERAVIAHMRGQPHPYGVCHWCKDLASAGQPVAFIRCTDTACRNSPIHPSSRHDCAHPVGVVTDSGMRCVDCGMGINAADLLVPPRPPWRQP